MGAYICLRNLLSKQNRLVGFEEVRCQVSGGGRLWLQLDQERKQVLSFRVTAKACIHSCVQKLLRFSLIPSCISP